MNVFCRAPFNYDTAQASDEAGLKCEDESLAQQHQKDEADINNIVRKFIKTGELPEDFRVPKYGDFSEIKDYQSALNTVSAANASFMMLSAEIRQKFANSPEAFVEFCLNPENREEMIKLGLIEKEATVTSPVVVKPESAPAQPPKAGV